MQVRSPSGGEGRSEKVSSDLRPHRTLVHWYLLVPPAPVNKPVRRRHPAPALPGDALHSVTASPSVRRPPTRQALCSGVWQRQRAPLDSRPNGHLLYLHPSTPLLGAPSGRGYDPRMAIRFGVRGLRKLRRLLRRERPEPAVPGYYVTKYMTDRFGTILQLEKGLRDHRVKEPIPGELLGRLIDAWRAMKKAPNELPDAYRVGGEWQSIISKSFLPLTRAFEEEDHSALNDLLQSFFRKFGDFFGEPTDFTAEAHRRGRCEHFRVYAARWIDLYGEEAIHDARPPLIGNPIGFVIDGALIAADSFRHNFYARRMLDLADDIKNPVVCEVGGGFGGFAYHLLNRPQKSFKYIDYDIPVMCLVAAYYLTTAFPKKRVRLFGEVGSLVEPVRDCDVAILPNFALPHLQDRSVDICFNTCSFAEMDEPTVQEYTRQFERVCRRFILYEDHSWTSSSANAYYQPMGGFKHWNLSRIEPSPVHFKRLHKIPSPFHADLFGEFFEWLYMRR